MRATVADARTGTATGTLIGTAEAAITDTTGDPGRHAALASPVRRRMLVLISESAEPMAAVAIAAASGLHLTTTRFHLELLERAGLVRRTVCEEKRRGRPRLLYSAADVDRAENSREQLIGSLAAALAASADSDARAVEAGREWARALAAENPEPIEPREGLLEVLDRLGFEPTDEGATVQLAACPFRDAARRHPDIICAMHQGLVNEVLGEASSTTRLLPFVQPNRCVITLH